MSLKERRIYKIRNGKAVGTGQNAEPVRYLEEDVILQKKLLFMVSSFRKEKEMFHVNLFLVVLRVFKKQSCLPLRIENRVFPREEENIFLEHL